MPSTLSSVSSRSSLMASSSHALSPTSPASSVSHCHLEKPVLRVDSTWAERSFLVDSDASNDLSPVGSCFSPCSSDDEPSNEPGWSHQSHLKPQPLPKTRPRCYTTPSRRFPPPGLLPESEAVHNVLLSHDSDLLAAQSRILQSRLTLSTSHDPQLASLAALQASMAELEKTYLRDLHAMYNASLSLAPSPVPATHPLRTDRDRLLVQTQKAHLRRVEGKELSRLHQQLEAAEAKLAELDGNLRKEDVQSALERRFDWELDAVERRAKAQLEMVHNMRALSKFKFPASKFDPVYCEDADDSDEQSEKSYFSDDEEEEEELNIYEDEDDDDLEPRFDVPKYILSPPPPMRTPPAAPRRNVATPRGMPVQTTRPLSNRSERSAPDHSPTFGPSPPALQRTDSAKRNPFQHIRRATFGGTAKRPNLNIRELVLPGKKDVCRIACVDGVRMTMF